MCSPDGGRQEHQLHLAAEEVGECRCGAAVRHVDDVDARHQLEQLGSHVKAAADAGRAEVDLAGICLCVGDQFGNAFRRDRRVNRENERPAGHGDEGDVADEVEAEVRIQARIDRDGRVDSEQRIAVRRRPHDRLGRDVAGGATPVLDDERLAEPRGQRLTYQADENVGAAAGRIADDAAERPCRISLCRCNAGSAGSAAMPPAKCRNRRRENFMASPRAARERGATARRPGRKCFEDNRPPMAPLLPVLPGGLRHVRTGSSGDETISFDAARKATS